MDSNGNLRPVIASLDTGSNVDSADTALLHNVRPSHSGAIRGFSGVGSFSSEGEIVLSHHLVGALIETVYVSTSDQRPSHTDALLSLRTSVQHRFHLLRIGDRDPSVVGAPIVDPCPLPMAANATVTAPDGTEYRALWDGTIDTRLGMEMAHVRLEIDGTRTYVTRD